MRQILETAERRSPRISAARSEAESQRFGARAAHDALNPKISAGAGVLYDPVEEKRLIPRTRLEDLSRDEAFNSTIVDVGATLSYPLLSREISHRAKAKDAAAQAAASSIGISRDQVLFGIIQKYYSILLLDRAILATEASIKGLEETQRAVKKKIEVGRTPPIDLFRINSRLSKIQLDRLGFRNERKKRWVELEELAGVEFDEHATLRDDLRPLTVDFNKEEGIRFALDHRPELDAARYTLNEAHALENVAEATFIPKINLIVNGSVNWGNDAQQAVEDFFVGVRLSMPLFDPTFSARKAKAMAKIEATKWRLQGVQRKVRSEVQSAFLDFDKAGEAIAVTEDLLKEAKEAFRVETRRYETGFSTVNDVLQAQAELLRAELEIARALVEQKLATARLYWVRGDMRVDKLAP